MEQTILALLVHEQPEPVGMLQPALESQSIKICRARDCQEASQALSQAGPPHLVFTDTVLPDGTWLDVLNLAANARQPVNVIVVARLADVKFYIEVIDRGAFDFITPPFAPYDLSHVVRCAADNVLSRRHVQGHAA